MVAVGLYVRVQQYRVQGRIGFVGCGGVGGGYHEGCFYSGEITRSWLHAPSL